MFGTLPGGALYNPELLRQNANEYLTKALDSTTESGQALIPEIINPTIVELALQVAPLRQLLPRTPWKSGTYDRNKRLAFGRARAIGDGTSAPETQSTYQRFQESLKILQSKGGVTGFMQAASQELLDSLASEVAGSTVACMYEEENLFLYGNPDADPWMWKGMDYWMHNTGANLVHANGGTVTIAMLDEIIDTVQSMGIILNASNSWLQMSHRMLSKFSSLDTTKQRFNDRVDVEGGFRYKSYRGIPIHESSFIKANQAWPGSTVTATGATTGGTLAAGDYKYYIAAVLLTGETLPATEVTGTVSSGTTGKVTLGWSAPATSGSVRLYKIYRTAVDGGSGTEVLYTTIPGVIYQADSFGFLSVADTVEWVDTGDRTEMTTTYASGSVSGAAYTPDVAPTQWDELAADEEDIHLFVKMHPAITDGGQGLALEVPTLKPLGMIPLARISDKEWFINCEYSCLVCVPQFQGVITRAKIS